MIKDEPIAGDEVIHGMLQDIDDERSVFVGQVPGESGVYIKFRKGETITRLRLSFEAAEVLRELLERTSERGLMSRSEWTVIAHVVAKEGPDEISPQP